MVSEAAFPVRFVAISLRQMRKMTPIKVIDRFKSTSLWPGNMHILSVQVSLGFWVTFYS